MKRHSTFVKLFLDNLVVMVVILAIAGLVTYNRLNANYQTEAQVNQARLVHVAAEHFRQLWPLGQGQVDHICKTLLPDHSARLTVIAADGRVLGDSDTDPLTMVNHRTADRPEIMAALEGRDGNDTRRSGTLGLSFRYMALPLSHEGQVVAVVRVAVPVRSIAEGESLLRNAIVWSALTGTAAAVLLGLLASWIWYAPLRRISLAAKQIASGDLSRTASLRDKGRLGDLAVSLNEMRDNLGKYLGQIAAQHQNFQAVLTNLQEGVIATDIDDRVVLINQAAGRLTGTDTDSAGGKHIQSVLPVLEIIRFYEQATSSDVPVSCAFETDLGQGRRQIEVHVVRVPPGASSIHHLLVIRDVTELSGAAAMKAQFVANASHELRTPLATIRAAVDSLAAADPNDRPELAKLTGMLDRHVARLEDMTKDLLDLHMVESAKVPLNLTEVACGALAAWVKEQFTAPAAEKGLRLDVAAPSPQVRFSSDRKLLELIFRNLIDNAIKFTPAGGRVDCRFEPDEGGLCVTIGDTGCGISAKDLSHVFERFYQGDAARSGQAKTRGTGLGLAIVKHASERLGAKVELTSQLGQGTQVTVVIPNARSSPL